MKNKFIYLSHVLSNETVGYAGKNDFNVVQTQSISAGQSCNQSEWKLNNHIGTHIDAPFHFSNGGKTLDQLPAEFWIFNQVHLVEHAVAASSLIDVGSWCEAIPKEADLLLIKTSFEKKRNSSEYWEHNPGLTPELGLWLRKNRTHMRAVGFDFISLTSFDHRALGKKAHHAFLSEESPGQPILIIEDMHLDNLQGKPTRVAVVPLRVLKSDGSPVTALAEL